MPVWDCRGDLVSSFCTLPFFLVLLFFSLVAFFLDPGAVITFCRCRCVGARKAGPSSLIARQPGRWGGRLGGACVCVRGGLVRVVGRAGCSSAQVISDS